jgi:hypothetical protein
MSLFCKIFFSLIFISTCKPFLEVSRIEKFNKEPSFLKKNNHFYGGSILENSNCDQILRLKVSCQCETNNSVNMNVENICVLNSCLKKCLFEKKIIRQSFIPSPKTSFNTLNNFSSKFPNYFNNRKKLQIQKNPFQNDFSNEFLENSSDFLFHKNKINAPRINLKKPLKKFEKQKNIYLKKNDLKEKSFYFKNEDDLQFRPSINLLTEEIQNFINISSNTNFDKSLSLISLKFLKKQKDLAEDDKTQLEDKFYFRSELELEE